MSEHGAAVLCDPEKWLPEAARLLRPGGRLVFMTNSQLSSLCVPDEEGVAGERLLRGQRETYQVQWPGGGVEFHPSHGDWVRLLSRAGFVVVAMHEIYAPPDADDHAFYEIAVTVCCGHHGDVAVRPRELGGPTESLRVHRRGHRPHLASPGVDDHCRAHARFRCMEPRRR